MTNLLPNEGYSNGIPVELTDIEQLQDGTIRAMGVLPPAISLDAIPGYSIGFDPAGDGYAALFKHQGHLVPKAEPVYTHERPDPWAYFNSIEMETPPIMKRLVEEAVRRDMEYREVALEQLLKPLIEDAEGRRLVREILERHEVRVRQAQLDMLIKGETDVVIED